MYYNYSEPPLLAERHIILKIFILLLILVFSYRILTDTPIEQFYYVIESVFIFAMILFLAYYILYNLLTNKAFSLLEIFAFLMLLFPFYSAFMANIEFAQPFFTGVIAQRKYFLLIGAIFIYYLLKSGFINLKTVETTFIILAWASLISYLLLIVFIDPVKVEGSHYIGTNAAKGGLTYKFDVIFILFGVIYYFIKGMRKNNFKYFVYAIVFLSYIIVFQRGRGLLLGVLFTLLLYFVLNNTLSKMVFYFGIFLLAILAAFSVLLITVPEFIDLYFNSYKNIFQVFLGEESGDLSADSRIRQLNQVFEFYGGDLRRFLFGSGKLSHDFNLNAGIFTHVSVSDIGVFGIILVFGIFGLLFFKLQYFFAYIFWKKIKFQVNTPPVFFYSLVYFLIYLFIHSLQTGEDTFEPTKCMAVLFILFFYLRNSAKVIMR